jgi:hypothetical protein
MMKKLFFTLCFLVITLAMLSNDGFIQKLKYFLDGVRTGAAIAQ